ncbi:PREDICTED: UDP-glucuronosyltransferase 2C1-like [Polistes dominula]|uniref:UDP-glucuronosyltransferase n=1 Tax=Polistes dominula TaxID=743375 RepID=A0ABM1I5Y7_POLDO|nr:PREDICTED: UDP-glucuronosyltransferase 2C1-like [Polistes dominula]
MNVLTYIIVCLTMCLTLCQSYRILGIFTFHGKSHFIMFEALMKGLAKKGHQVDVISTFPLKKPVENYTDLVSIPVKLKLVNNVSYEFMKMALSGAMAVNAVASIGGNDLCEYLELPEIQKIIKNPPQNPPYDAVLIEIFGASCFGIFGNILNVPVIGVSSSALYPWANPYIANPENLAFVRNNLLSYVKEMNFGQRVYNTLHTLFNKMYFNYKTTKYQDELIKKHVGPNMPSVREVETNISLILVNTYFSLNGIKPKTPALIEVGGLHVQDDDDTELSPELKKWADECDKDGFIYFSFGSMVNIETFPKHILDIFYKSFEYISPVKILMKIPNPKNLPPGLPNNVRIAPWLPQLKILKHPNIRAFITHGGLMGTQEAIACGVPMIGIPLFADQFTNIESYVEKNIAIKLDYETMTQNDMNDALHKIVYNSTYRKTARIIADKFIDRPLKPIDTANYWIEYVIKHGYNSLHSPALNLYWWQVALLDVYVFIFVVTLVIIYLIVHLTLLLLNVFSSNSKVTHKKKVT